MWAGKVGFRHVNVCVEQQVNNPRSRIYVAARGGDIRWSGHDEQTRLLSGVYNLIAALLNGLGGKVKQWPSIEIAGSDEKLFAKDIASFDPAEFMGVINGV